MSVDSKLVKKGALATLCAFALVLATLCGCSSSQSAASSSASASASSSASAAATEPEAENVVTLVVVDPENEGVNIFDEAVAINEGDTVYSVIENSGIPADIQDGQYGKYMTSLNGIAAEGSSGWVYTINGEEVMESMDAAVVNPGDTVEFTYMSF